jgi:hypothetical protein
MEFHKKRHNYSFGNGVTLKGVAMIANLHLQKMGACKLTCSKEFVDDLLTACEDFAIESRERLRMPFDLGYMQVLKHDSAGNNIQWLNKFYGDDFSVVWLLHPLFSNIAMSNNFRLKKRLVDFIQKTRKKNYLQELPDGDYFFLKHNEYVASAGFDRFRHRKESYARNLPRKVVYLQSKRQCRRLLVPKPVQLPEMDSGKSSESA